MTDTLGGGGGAWGFFPLQPAKQKRHKTKTVTAAAFIKVFLFSLSINVPPMPAAVTSREAVGRIPAPSRQADYRTPEQAACPSRCAFPFPLSRKGIPAPSLPASPSRRQAPCRPPRD